MNRKTQAAYEGVLEYIDEHVLPLRGVASFTTDFELAMRNALNRLDPSVKRFTCYFHFCQAVKRRAWQTPGLVKIIRSNAKARWIVKSKWPFGTSISIFVHSFVYVSAFSLHFRSIYYRLLCLPLLPAEHISAAFRELFEEAMIVDRPGFHLFFEYFNSQWMIKEGPQNISVNETTMRTTSSLEANNGVMNSTVVNHGNFFSFVYDLRQQEFLSSMRFHRHFESGGQAKLPRFEYRVRVCLVYIIRFFVWFW